MMTVQDRLRRTLLVRAFVEIYQLPKRRGKRLDVLEKKADNGFLTRGRLLIVLISPYSDVKHIPRHSLGFEKNHHVCMLPGAE